jgi:hypothetical protein
MRTWISNWWPLIICLIGLALVVLAIPHVSVL